MFSVRRVRLVRFGFLLAAWGLVALGSFLVFDGLIGSNDGQAELACAKAKLEAMWDVHLPASAEVVGSIPGSGVVSADWDLEELGCSGAIYPTATLKLPE